MPYLNVCIVDEDNTPVSGARVVIVISRDTFPNNLTIHTDNDGIAQFQFGSGISADIYVGGILELLHVDLDREVTVSIKTQKFRTLSMMLCKNVGDTHELEIINTRSQQAAGEQIGIFHFDGECRRCFAPYWQHGSRWFPNDGS